jgi:hypothetical protein
MSSCGLTGAWLFQGQEFYALTSHRGPKYAVFAKLSPMTPWTSNLVKRPWNSHMLGSD